MPAIVQKQRRFLSIRDGWMIERVQDQPENKFNRLDGMWLVNVTYRDVTKDGVFKGQVLQLHLLDTDDYFILDLWQESSYARAFSQVMQNIDFSMPLSISTREKVENGVKKGAMFIAQDGLPLKWCYTKTNMQDCPPGDMTVDASGKQVWDFDRQQTFFMYKIESFLLPMLKQVREQIYKVIPFHPVYDVANPANANESPQDLPF